MLDFDRVVGFDWDDGNRRKNADKHDVSQSEAEQVFFNEPLLMVLDHRHRLSERRIHALGRTDDGRPLHVTFTLRGEETLIRVISARVMNRRERAHYDKGA